MIIFSFCFGMMVGGVCVGLWVWATFRDLFKKG